MEFKEALQEGKKNIDSYKRPFILYDDDPDGLSALLLLYRYKKEGKHMPVKSSPKVGEMFLPKIEEFDPDVLIVLDKPLIDEEFLRKLRVPVLWFDHHPKEKLHTNKLKEYNPCDWGIEKYPTARIMYDVVGQDKWIAGLGCIGDWTKPPLIEELRKEYPDLITKDEVQDILFATRWGTYVKWISFMLKLPTKKYQRLLKKLIAMKSPYDLEQQEIREEIAYIEGEYDTLLAEAKRAENNKGIRTYLYKGEKNSFTKELANEMMFLYPKDTIIIGREKDGQIKMSMRSPQTLPDAVQQAMQGLRGYGGGHPNACGGQIDKEDFSLFAERLRAQLEAKHHK